MVEISNQSRFRHSITHSHKKAKSLEDKETALKRQSVNIFYGDLGWSPSYWGGPDLNQKYFTMKPLNSIRKPLIAFSVMVLAMGGAYAQTGVNRLPGGNVLKIGNDTIVPRDTLLSVLDENDSLAFLIDRNGALSMPMIDSSASSNQVLVRDPDGKVRYRNLAPSVLTGDDGDWVVKPDMIHDPDSTFIVRPGITTQPSLEIYKPSVSSAAEGFFKARMALAPNDHISIFSGTSANTTLYPVLMGHVEQSAGVALGLFGQTTAAQDVGNVPVVRFEARRTNSRIFTRPLFAWSSYQATWMTMTANGWLGIGTPTPSAQLEITGDAMKPGTNTWTNPSDLRLKKNIRDFEDGLKVLQRIRPVWYEFNGKANMPTGKEYVGVIAQEMIEAAPYTISEFEFTDGEGNLESYLKYDGNALVYILVNAVQEQQALIDQLSHQLSEVEARLSSLDREPDFTPTGDQEVTHQTAKR